MYPKLCENIETLPFRVIADLQLLPVSLTRKISEIFVKYRELIHENRLNNSEGLIKAEIIARKEKMLINSGKLHFKIVRKK